MSKIYVAFTAKGSYERSQLVRYEALLNDATTVSNGGSSDVHSIYSSMAVENDWQNRKTYES